MQRQTRRNAAEGPELPIEAVHLWDWYREIDLGRGSNGFGPNPLTFSDIHSWAILTGRTLRVSETRVILLLDQLWREAWSESAKGRRNWLASQRGNKGR